MPWWAVCRRGPGGGWMAGREPGPPDCGSPPPARTPHVSCLCPGWGSVLSGSGCPWRRVTAGQSREWQLRDGGAPSPGAPSCAYSPGVLAASWGRGVGPEAWIPGPGPSGSPVAGTWQRAVLCPGLCQPCPLRAFSALSWFPGPLQPAL